MKEFEGNIKSLGENTEKYITFSVPIKKKIENKDMGITYKIKSIDSFRFMATSLSKLVDKKNYEKEINKELIERFASTYKFCNNDLNKFVMLLRKGVYPYEYMDGWDKFN